MDKKVKIMKALEEFNKYRVPEVKARLDSIKDDALVVEFTGSFCETCGFYDYFDDFKFILDDHGVTAAIDEIEEIYEGAVVWFSFRKTEARADYLDHLSPVFRINS
jgi:superoxide reductase